MPPPAPFFTFHFATVHTELTRRSGKRKAVGILHPPLLHFAEIHIMFTRCKWNWIIRQEFIIKREDHMSYINTISAAEDFRDCPIIRASEKRGTIYLVEYSTGDNAKETIYEKVKRLILNDCEAFKPISAR